MFEKVVVVDCAGHMLGRVASVIAKEVMNGQKVVAVRTEELNISGSLFRHKLIYGKFLIHRGNTNPTRGPNHYRSPSRILWRTVRGMMNHFKARGQAAMARLKAFEGCPHPYDKTKKVVIPSALRVLRLRPGRKYCRLGDLSQQVGWQHDNLIKSLEEKRKTKAAAWYQTKLQLAGLRAKANAAADAKLGIQRPKKAAAPAKAAAAAPAKAAAAAPEPSMDDADPFAEKTSNPFEQDDEELTEEEKERERIIAEKAKKLNDERAAKGKKKEAGRSTLILDVKPLGSDTDMKELEAAVRKIEMDGLRWAGSELVAIGYGIKKLRIISVIVDDLVSTDVLREKIEAMEEMVQSTDIFAFNKV